VHDINALALRQIADHLLGEIIHARFDGFEHSRGECPVHETAKLIADCLRDEGTMLDATILTELEAAAGKPIDFVAQA